ncbi:unnamed protein product [Caenorhabditis angaria]|uniref:Prefoldin subunit 5 n=1 Tax=Caenorhabditis angaria TaxID=860376 RepID=A0A9P1IN30_9PELO|nr:unnamed protein product [Caenorhabditis angaria]
MADESKGVPISELGIEQINQLQKQVEQEMQFFQESLQTLKMLSQRNDKTLIPLSESLYIRAEIPNPDKNLVEIGTGYFVELDREKAKGIFDRKKQHMLNQIETVEKILVDKRKTRAILSDTFQSKIQAQLAQIQQAK